MATQHHIVLAGSLFDPKANSSDSRELSASSGFAATLSAASSWFQNWCAFRLLGRQVSPV